MPKTLLVPFDGPLTQHARFPSPRSSPTDSLLTSWWSRRSSTTRRQPTTLMRNRPECPRSACAPELSAASRFRTRCVRLWTTAANRPSAWPLTLAPLSVTPSSTAWQKKWYANSRFPRCRWVRPAHPNNTSTGPCSSPSTARSRRTPSSRSRANGHSRRHPRRARARLPFSRCRDGDRARTGRALRGQRTRGRR